MYVLALFFLKRLCVPYTFSMFPFVSFAPFFCPFTSDKTDMESTHSAHSSNMSGGHHHHSLEKQVIPPDALYASNEKIMMKNNQGYISYEAVFNDSKVRKVNKSMENLAIIW